MSGLEAEPEHGALAEEAGESQRCLRRNATLAVEDVVDPPRGRAQRQRQRVGRTCPGFRARAAESTLDEWPS
jgi:hypothetical protein